MSQSSYTDSRLVAIYDTLNPPGPENEFYTKLAGREARNPILVAAGFSDIESFGDWDRSDIGPSSSELIIVAR